MTLNPNVNRVAQMIERQENTIAQRLATGQSTKEQVDALHKTLNMQLDEYCRFQQIKSLAFAGGKITADEAQTIYVHLGTSVDFFNSRPIAVKVVLTQIFQEFLEMLIKAKRRTG